MQLPEVLNLPKGADIKKIAGKHVTEKKTIDRKPTRVPVKRKDRPIVTTELVEKAIRDFILKKGLLQKEKRRNLGKKKDYRPLSPICR